MISFQFVEMNEIETETVKGNEHRSGLLLTSVRSLVQSHYLLTAIDECQSVFSQQHSEAHQQSIQRHSA